jgi:hypothetical protein
MGVEMVGNKIVIDSQLIKKVFDKMTVYKIVNKKMVIQKVVEKMAINVRVADKNGQNGDRLIGN